MELLELLFSQDCISGLLAILETEKTSFDTAALAITRRGIRSKVIQAQDT